MTTYGFSNAAGLIQWTNSAQITDPNQLAALTAQGITQTIIPDGSNGATGMIINGAYVPNNPSGPAIPDPVLQLIAAQINAGSLDASAFHPITLTNMNIALAAVNMATITIPASTSATNSTAVPAN